MMSGPAKLPFVRPAVVYPSNPIYEVAEDRQDDRREEQCLEHAPRHFLQLPHLVIPFASKLLFLGSRLGIRPCISFTLFSIDTCPAITWRSSLASCSSRCARCLALLPALTTGFPIKKWSAAAALAAAAFYLLLSGAEVATQRSFFMTAVVLIAVMVDRRAVTFRTLAVAAMMVLTLAPEALVHPSFQMSFAATLGLVALVQIGMPRLFASPDHSTTAKVALWAAANS